ncbi:MAG: hypothetical protein JSW56_06040 [Deltaproteobacteria bacterium]|nr:MAG: hypothetical protein JSW56_06040 [Deltaproteobacteria bacterium]
MGAIHPRSEEWGILACFCNGHVTFLYEEDDLGFPLSQAKRKDNKRRLSFKVLKNL